MTAPLAERPFDAVVVGESLVDMLPSVIGPLAQVPMFERCAGGAPANVAVGMARLGSHVRFVGTVGSDGFGEYLVSALHNEGVETSGMRRVAGRKTGMAFVSLDEEGRPRFHAAGGGAEFCLEPSDIAHARIEDARFLVLGTFVMKEEAPRKASLEAVRKAREAGTLIALDPNVRLHVWNQPEDLHLLLNQLVPEAQVIKLSSDECEFVAGESDPLLAARALVHRGARLAVVTTGPDGCTFVLRNKDKTIEGSIPTRRIVPIDTTGAGDAFFAALLTGLSSAIRADLSLEELDRATLANVLKRANEAGTRVCERVGAMPGLPREGELSA